MRLLIGLLALLTWSVQAKDLKDDVIYFVMLDRFADGNIGNNQGVELQSPLAFHGGDLAGLTSKLPYIKSLGATAVWLTPINTQIAHNISSEYGEFAPHHGYWANDLASIDPRFGTEQQLAQLVKEAHHQGLKVILDVVYNHLGYGADWEASKPEWLRTGSQCGGDEVTACLAGLPDLRTELPEVQRYLFSTHLQLAKRVGLDGFRLDTVKHIDHVFWQEHRRMADEILGEDFILLGEIWGADRFSAKEHFKNDEMDAVFEFAFRDRTVDFLNGLSSPKKYARYLVKRHKLGDGYALAPFLSNHDMPTLLSILKGDKSRYLLAMTVLLSIEGVPTITWGEEWGREGGVWPQNRENMYWQDDTKPNASWHGDKMIWNRFNALLQLRANSVDLRSGVNDPIYADDEVIVLQRGDNMLLVINRGKTPVEWSPDVAKINEWDLVYSSVDNKQIGDFIGPVEARIYQRR